MAGYLYLLLRIYFIFMVSLYFHLAAIYKKNTLLWKGLRHARQYASTTDFTYGYQSYVPEYRFTAERIIAIYMH